jgi:hypothetical protein
MERPIHRVVNAVWSENTIIAVVILALLDFFSKAVGLVQSPSVDRASALLYPAFIVVILLEIYLIRARGNSKLDSVAGELGEIKRIVSDENSALDSIRSDISGDVIKQLDEIKKKVNEQFSYEAFSTGDEFDTYLKARFQEAKDVKVIHLSSGTSDKRSGRGYYEVLENFVKKGGTFTRIFSDTGNVDVFRWIKEDLEQYQSNKYFIYFLNEVFVTSEMRTMGIMIIDKSEVCLGGGYETEFANPTLSIKNPTIVEFFMDYFNYLSRCATGIRSQNRPTRWDILNARITALQIALNTDGTDQARN